MQEDDGSAHLIGGIGRIRDGSGYLTVHPTWLHEKSLYVFIYRPLQCGFGAATAVVELSTTAETLIYPAVSTQLTSLFRACPNQQYGRRDNTWILGVEEETDEDLYQKGPDVAAEAGAPVSQQHSSNCLWVPSKIMKNGEVQSNIVHFVSRQTKTRLISSEYMPKEAGKRDCNKNDSTLIYLLKDELKQITLFKIRKAGGEWILHLQTQ